VIALLTQLIYPVFYDDLLRSTAPMLLVLTARNALYVALLAWAIVQLVRQARFPSVREDGEWLPEAWPFARPRRGEY
jgi:hypothetical protein